MNRRIFIKKYVKPYWLPLSLSVILAIFGAVLNSASIYSIAPLFKVILHPDEMQVDKNVHKGISQNEQRQMSIVRQAKEFKDRVKGIGRSLIVRDNPKNSLILLALMILGLRIGYSLAVIFSTYILVKFDVEVTKKLRDDVFDHISHLPIPFFDTKKTGMVVSNIVMDIQQMMVSYRTFLIGTIQYPILIVLYFAMIFWISVSLALVVLTLMGIHGIMVFKLGKKVKKHSFNKLEAIGDITSYLQEVVQGIHAVKGFVNELFTSKRFQQKTSVYSRQSFQLWLYKFIVRPINEWLIVLSICVLVVIGGFAVLEKRIAVEQMLLFLVLIFSLKAPIGGLLQAFTSYKTAVGASVKVFEMFNLPLEADTDKKKINTVHPVNLRIKTVSFSYSNEGEKVLDNVSFSINQGEIVGLVGSSGAGKSTLADLILRFYNPQEGEILLNGLNIKDISLKEYRSLFGIVRQDTFLFNDTIRANILFGKPDATEGEMIRMAKLAYAHDFIMETPNGYDTVIGDRGVCLSGGQRQRLAIARAVLKDPGILILDEATSSLDTKSEQIVQKAIDNLIKNRTVFAIAHRLSTLLSADKIIVLEKGRILDVDNHENLFKRCEKYREFYDLQFGEAE